MYTYDFRVTGYPFRLYSGTDALERLPAEVARNGARRAFIVCGRTVSRRTPLISRKRELLGERLAGVFDEIDKDTSRSSVMRATEAARSARGDLVIGVGAGSVIQGARIVTILLAEKRPVEQLVTQYPEHGPAISPKLLEPKLPIVNVLTAPTTAQNRAGSRMKDDATARGMEFFDPKTRPVAIFWDADALLTAPPQLIRTGAATIWCRAVMNLGATADNPLVEATAFNPIVSPRGPSRASPTRPIPHPVSTCARRRSCKTASPTTAASSSRATGRCVSPMLSPRL